MLKVCLRGTESNIIVTKYEKEIKGRMMGGIDGKGKVLGNKIISKG